MRNEEVLDKLINHAVLAGDTKLIKNQITERDKAIQELVKANAEALKQQGEYKQGRRDVFVLKSFEVMFSKKAEITLGDIAEVSVAMADLLIKEMDSNNTGDKNGEA